MSHETQEHLGLNILTISVDHAASHVFALEMAVGDGVVKRCDSESRLHVGVDGIAHDPVGEDVLERANVKPAFTGLDSSSRRNS